MQIGKGKKQRTKKNRQKTLINSWNQRRRKYGWWVDVWTMAEVYIGGFMLVVYLCGF